MIYKTLRKLPMVTYLEIIESGDFRKLNDSEEVNDKDLPELLDIWTYLRQEYIERYDRQNHNKIFNATKEINYLAVKYDEIACIIEALKFVKDERLINIIKNYGYKLNMETYLDDLTRVDRESKGIIQKINSLKSVIPKEAENAKSNEKPSESIINAMASYSAILGYDFDFYTISVEKYHSISQQVKQKIAAVEKQNTKTKKR